MIAIYCIVFLFVFLSSWNFHFSFIAFISLESYKLRISLVFIYLQIHLGSTLTVLYIRLLFKAASSTLIHPLETYSLFWGKKDSSIEALRLISHRLLGCKPVLWKKMNLPVAASSLGVVFILFISLSFFFHNIFSLVYREISFIQVLKFLSLLPPFFSSSS